MFHLKPAASPTPVHVMVIRLTTLRFGVAGKERLPVLATLPSLPQSAPLMGGEWFLFLEIRRLV
ncbi:hypothetical protein Poly51_48900 [Rubripirellula tenax]|uniref:Uncharacterized protein n=1 Tax=Rubripirellula tenax TaxID=2528015 RepID=A0A5C6EN39_9BACT|nr:hypothetical protein Poly51_48900 [Rubripirellula tenax]